MKHLFKPKFFKGLLAALAVFLAAKVLWFGAEMLFLPAAGTNYMAEKTGEPLYYRVKLTPNESRGPRKKKPKVALRHTDGSIDEIRLLALYNSSDMTIATVNYKSKNKVMERGDNISGFVLEGGGQDFVTFSKKNRTYTVMLSKDNKKSKNTVEDHSAPVAKAKKPKVSEKKGNITDAGDHKIVDRTLIEYYTKNMREIYKNIGVTEMKDGGKLQGFRLNFVKKNSDFEKLGVKRNDIIKSVNGKAITSYNAAFGIYKNIQNSNNISMVVQRGNEEMELEYEIE